MINTPTGQGELVDTIINAFFSNQGIPSTGLVPILRIWQITPISNILIINSDPMLEIGDGFYKYEFLAFDPLHSYLFRADGGNALMDHDRYTIGSTDTNSNPSTISNAIWDEPRSEHLIPGTTGEVLSVIHSNVEQLRLSVIDAISLANLLVKFQANRTVIDKVAKTLTVYDNDKSTPIHTFNLIDGNGDPSVDEVCERDPM